MSGNSVNIWFQGFGFLCGLFSGASGYSLPIGRGVTLGLLGG